MNFKIGDIVKLRSGGPLLTVVRLVPEHNPRPFIVCRWFADDKLEDAMFEPECLAIVDLVDIGKAKTE